MTRGGAIPSGTLESPLSTSRARALARTPMLHQHAEKSTWFRKRLCSDVCIHFRPVYANAAMHDPISSRLEIVVAPLIS